MGFGEVAASRQRSRATGELRQSRCAARCGRRRRWTACVRTRSCAIAGCAACASRRRDLLELKQHLRTELPRHAAPELRARLIAEHGAAAPGARTIAPTGDGAGSVPVRFSGGLAAGLIWAASLGLVPLGWGEDLSARVVGLHPGYAGQSPDRVRRRTATRSSPGCRRAWTISSPVIGVGGARSSARASTSSEAGRWHAGLETRPRRRRLRAARGARRRRRRAHARVQRRDRAGAPRWVAGRLRPTKRTFRGFVEAWRAANRGPWPTEPSPREAPAPGAMFS